MRVSDALAFRLFDPGWFDRACQFSGFSSSADCAEGVQSFVSRSPSVSVGFIFDKDLWRLWCEGRLNIPWNIDGVHLVVSVRFYSYSCC